MFLTYWILESIPNFHRIQLLWNLYVSYIYQLHIFQTLKQKGE